MRKGFILILILPSYLLFGQKGEKFSLVFNLQPELTSYKNNYDYILMDTYSKSSFNIDFETAVQYDFTKRIFTETGLGFISRKLITTASLNQHVLPPPYHSLTAEGVATKSISFRTLEFPLSIGYRFITKKK